MRIDGVVVLYNPNADAIDSIKRYNSFLNKVFVIDNSTKVDDEIVKEIKKISNVNYISLNGNQGIAKALRVGLAEAIKDNADMCLTMDQDSQFPSQDIDVVLDYLNKYKDEYAIIGLNFNSEDKTKGLIECKTILTSGNFINIEDYKKIHGFSEELFIDCVDFELNEQFANIARKICYINEVSLIHQMGNPIKKKFFGKTVTALNHSPIRYYYRFRNGYYLYKRNKAFYKDLKKQFFSIKLKTLLYEPDKRAKFKMMRLGIKDAKKGKLGKLEN